MKIPGLTHEVFINASGGVHQLELKLRTDTIATSAIKSRTEQGIRKALETLVIQAEISHQVQSSILDNLAKKLMIESGYLDEQAATAAAGIPIVEAFPEEYAKKIDQILELVMAIEQRLKKLEGK